MNVIVRTLFFLSAIAPAVVVSAAAQIYKHGGSNQAYGWIAAGALACVFPFLVIRAATSVSSVGFGGSLTAARRISTSP